MNSNFATLAARRNSDIPSLEPKSLVECIGRAGILGSETLDKSLCLLTQSLCSVICLADIGELVANTVGNDVRVESVLLALSHKRIGGQEGSLIGFTARAAELEVDSWDTITEVSGGVVIIVVVILVLAAVDDGGGSSRGCEESNEQSLGVHVEERVW